MFRRSARRSTRVRSLDAHASGACACNDVPPVDRRVWCRFLHTHARLGGRRAPGGGGVAGVHRASRPTATGPRRRAGLTRPALEGHTGRNGTAPCTDGRTSAGAGRMTQRSTMTDTQTDQRAAISDIVHGAHTALLTTVSEDGNLHARPLAVQDKTFHGTLRFLVQDGSEKVEDIARNPHVNVSIESQGGYLSIAGTATVTQDDSVVDELWSPFAEAWFPEGRQDPSIRLLTVEGVSVEYWTQDTGPVGSLVQMFKAALGKQSQPDTGDHGTVEL
ncbi:hypothetical protein DEJ04_07845 [Curtobacterium sp. MCLR17_044]|nr:hypothetical protein DEJ04_07845 [Curtobacterium sp. MCLR17_044]